MLVFVSLLMVTGMAGQYLYPVAFTVPIAMLASLLVAYTVTPWAANRWLKPGEGHDLEDHNPKDRLHRFYHALMAPLIDRPRLRRGVLPGVVAVVLLSLLQPAWQFVRPGGISGAQSWLGVEMAMLPKDNKNTFNITLDMPEPTPLKTTDRAVREIGAVLRENALILNYQSWIGEAGVIDFNGLLRGAGNKAGPHVAEIRVNLIDKAQRSKTSIEMVRELRQRLMAIQSRYPGSVIQLLEDSPGPPVRATVMAEIYGPELGQLRAIGKQVKDAFKHTYDMVEVNDSEPDDVQEYRLVVDREKAALSGVTTGEVAIALRRLLDGEELGRVHIAGKRTLSPSACKSRAATRSTRRCCRGST